MNLDELKVAPVAPETDCPQCGGLNTSCPVGCDPVPDNVEFGAPRVRLKWFTPDGDALVAHMARVSNTKASIDDPGDKLIGYLLRNHHWSPFEMVNLCLEIHTERDISAQILRHSKEFRFQEFSTRYAEVEELRYFVECRFQDFKNKQGSYTPEQLLEKMDGLDVRDAALFFPEGVRDGLLPGEQFNTSAHDRIHQHIEATASYWDALVNETRVRTMDGYREALARGVGKETARRILPFGLTPTVMYINSNLRGWIHYLAERTKPGVQKEHREIALAVEPIFEQCFPQVWKAVLAYRELVERKEQAALNWFKLEELLKTRDTVLVAPFGEGVGWAQNNGDYLWEQF